MYREQPWTLEKKNGKIKKKLKRQTKKIKFVDILTLTLFGYEFNLRKVWSK